MDDVTEMPVKALGERLSALIGNPDEQLVDEVVAQVQQLPPGPTQELVSALLGAALRAREEVAEHRQRERELHALFDTARDLTSFTDVDEVLRAIVDRVRRLLMADSCYVALKDEAAGDAYMRITAGTLSASIESVRQKPGQGIGGKIISSGRPFWTESYLEDPDIERVPSVAAAVEADGIQSIAGVPISSGGETIGALFIANRRKHRFSASEMALLASLGDQAAIALANANLIEELERNARSLRETNDSLRQRTLALQRSAHTHAQLTSLALDRASAHDFVAAVCELLGADVLGQVNEQGDVVAVHALPSAQFVVPELTQEAGALASGSGTSTERLSQQDSVLRERWFVPVRAGNSRLGYLFAAFSEAQTAVVVQNLEQSAQTAGVLELLERQTFFVEQQLRGELIDDLLSDRAPSPAVVERRAQRSGLLDPYAPHWVFVLSASGEITRKQLAELCARITGPVRGLASEYAGDIVAVVPLSAFADPQGFIKQVRDALRRAAPGSVLSGGVGGLAADYSQLRATHAEASRCLRIVLALGRSGEVLCRDDLGALGLVLEGTTRARVDRMLDRLLGPLMRYDRDHGAMLVETLEAYFEAGQNPRTAATTLFVHPNTVYQRLARIDHVLGTEAWREPAGSLEMQLALQFYRLTQHLPLEELLAEPPAAGPARAVS
ncbi:helix-turn-helix domain-containing protein [Ornithinimicrobium sufpigmenti]|uniref:helix-turn-helix domain-containing protein n=1 Tax=Ornithinimicrobium sufpigmenti TaxID=2508882 RepID=UPI001036C0E0|nr:MULTISPECIES: GAF domain-containing protein [unclassified Ornithinimicrobium]